MSCRVPDPEPVAACRRGRRGGFTLVEIVVVMAIVVLLLAIAGVAFNPAGGAKARKAARGEVVSMLTRARSHAISSGNPTAMAVVGLRDGPNAMRGKALGLFEVRRDEVAGTYEPVRQLRRWVSLSGRTLLLDGSAVRASDGQGLNALDEEPVLVVEVPSGEAAGMEEASVHVVVFEPTGAVSHPPGSGRIEFFIGEGKYGREGLVVTAKDDSGSATIDRVMLSRLTGRAQSLAAE